MMTVLAAARRGVGDDKTGRRSIDGHLRVKRLFKFLDRGSVYWLPLAFMFVAALARLAVPDVLDRLSLIWFDMCQRAQPRTASEVPVRIIDIDDKSLKQFGQWPWPRSLVAELVDKLSEAGAAVITFDVLFAERDRTSPQSLISLLSQAGVSGDEAQRLLSTMVDPDKKLAEAIAKTPVVVGLALSEGGGNGDPANKAGFAFTAGPGIDPLRYVERYSEAINDLPEFEQAAAGNGFVNEHLDWDNVRAARAARAAARDKPIASLDAETLRVAVDAKGYIGRGAGAQQREELRREHRTERRQDRAADHADRRRRPSLRCISRHPRKIAISPPRTS